MKKKAKIFLGMGFSAFALCGGFALMAASMTQDQLYEKMIALPIENIKTSIGLENKTKKEYQQYINSDKEFLSSIKIPDEYVALDVIIKDHTLTDKIFYPLMKFGHWAFNWSDNEKYLAEQRYRAEQSTYYSFFDENKNLSHDFIMLGLKSLHNKELDIYDSLYKAFDQNEQKMISFIHFHEFGHKIATHMNDENAKLQKIIHLFETSKGITLSQEDQHIIKTQYMETFADTFSLLLMSQKYPDLDLEKSQFIISGMRLSTIEDDHLTAPGVVSFQSKKNMSIKEIIDTSNQSALTTAQFYSRTSFIDDRLEREKPVHLIDINSDEIKSRMLMARDKYLESKQQKTNKLLN